MTSTTAPRWRGVHHLALVTTDMDATTRFYCGVLGASLVATVATEAFRHYFFEFAPGSTVVFFEYADVEVETLRTAAPTPRDGPPRTPH